MENNFYHHWGIVDSDCPIIVLKWLAKSYDLNENVSQNDINNSMGAGNINKFINPYYTFKNNTLLQQSYKWCVDQKDLKIPDLSIPYDEFGPTDDEPIKYNPILLYLIIKNNGLRINHLISDIHLLYKLLFDAIKTEKPVIERYSSFLCSIPIEKYDKRDLEKFLEDMNYSRTFIRNASKDILYIKLQDIYKNNIYKFEGCICVYTPNSSDVRCFKTNDLIKIFKNYNKLIDPVTEIDMTSEQKRQILNISRSYKITDLHDIIINLLKIEKDILLGSDSFAGIMLNKTKEDRISMMINIRDIFGYITSAVIKEDDSALLIISNYINNNYSIFNDLIVISAENIPMNQTIGSMLSSNIDNIIKLNLLSSTFNFYSNIKTI